MSNIEDVRKRLDKVKKPLHTFMGCDNCAALQSRIAELEKANEEGLRQSLETVAQLEQERDEARKQIEKMREALKKYGNHLGMSCDFEYCDGERVFICHCGFREAIGGRG